MNPLAENPPAIEAEGLTKIYGSGNTEVVAATGGDKEIYAKVRSVITCKP